MEIDPVKTFATQQDSGIIVNQQGTWEGDSKVAWRTLPSSYPQVPFSEWMVHGTGFKSTFKNHSKFWVLACTDVVMSGANSLVGTLATGVGSKDRSWCKLVICGYNMLQLNVTSQPEVWLWYGPNLCFTVFFCVVLRRFFSDWYRYYRATRWKRHCTRVSPCLKVRLAVRDSTLVSPQGNSDAQQTQ